MYNPFAPMHPPRTKLYADPQGKLLHDLVFATAERSPEKIAIVDTSTTPPREVTYAEYADLVERMARGLIAADIRPQQVVAIYLPNCWEFCAAFHAISYAGAVSTLLNPSYREREVRYQLENSEAVALITDGPLIHEMDLKGLPALKNVFYTRTGAGAAEPFSKLLKDRANALPWREFDPLTTLACLPYSSGTTGLPKGVMLTHANLVVNVFQTLIPGEAGALTPDDRMLCFLPLYHIYGLTVALDMMLALGGTLVLMPRFDPRRSLELLIEQQITMAPCVPPVLLNWSQQAEEGRFPKDSSLRWVKSGAAPLAPELALRFTAQTGVQIRQGYGMTEASPVTHLGFLEPEWYRPTSIGYPAAQTECRILDEYGNEVAPGECGELVMRGPQFMRGYWKADAATASVLRDGWYWSGDVARRDDEGFYFIVDRRKEMIKYCGFAVAPAEVEGVLLEHPAVRDCGVIGRPDAEHGEIPMAFIILRNPQQESPQLAEDLKDFVAQRITRYKQPREIVFTDSIPRTASGKILRRELRQRLETS
ncbi:AMP-dependent synthetase and ligase [Candidatus Koribacter versatilis Ellin345]|uniref:AMP-dependent synthetase and ligase n=1 Tax=Koribacter versatilis (strain Ellin345) TaxID=204669 RepID=Q1ITX8_KORVE|nr:AMP-dependent synthetase and ligase [Candidatus Koribacter versatilis Ellin345]